MARAKALGSEGVCWWSKEAISSGQMELGEGRGRRRGRTCRQGQTLWVVLKILALGIW